MYRWCCQFTSCAHNLFIFFLSVGLLFSIPLITSANNFWWPYLCSSLCFSRVSFSWHSQHPTTQFLQSMQCVFTTWVLYSKNSPIYSNACHFWVYYTSTLLDSGTIFLCWVKQRWNCGDTVHPLQLSHYVTATKQKPANPIHQHVLHNTVARSHVSPTYGLCVSASGYWHACTHASNRGFLLNANLAIICCIFWFAALYLPTISEVLSTFIVYIHNWRGGQKTPVQLKKNH